MAKETWKVDLSQLTLDDLIMLENVGTGVLSPTQIRDFLGRLVENKTEEEISQMLLSELRAQIGVLGKAIKEAVAIPK